MCAAPTTTASGLISMPHSTTTTTSNAFVAAMDASGAAMHNKVLGENGAPAHATSESPLVDLFFQLVRGLDENKLAQACDAVEAHASSAGAAGSNPDELADLIVLAFQTRASRGVGKGEKALFLSMFLWLARRFPETCIALVPLIGDYGYMKDYTKLLEAIHEMREQGRGAPEHEALEAAIVDLMAETLKADACKLDRDEKPQLSLMAKWLPREGKSCDKKIGLVGRLGEALFPGQPDKKRKYRQLTSTLNKELDTPEVKMCAGKFGELQPSHIPSLCMNRHRKAFLNESLKCVPRGADEEETGNRHPEDEDRVACRQAIVSMLADPSRVKGKQLHPHELVAQLRAGKARSLIEKRLADAQWGAVRSSVKSILEEKLAAKLAAGSMETDEVSGSNAVDLGNLVAVADVSGSMSGVPMHVSIALSILVSELASPAFKDRFITFSEQPSWVNLSDCADLASKVETTARAPWGCSTDFEKAMELILETAKMNKLSPDQIPDLIVFSDMQFNSASGRHSWETQHQRLTRRYAEVGRAVCGQPWCVPRIVYWNLRANTVGFPVQANTPNTQMISGFSPSLLSLVLQGGDLGGLEVVEEVQADGSVKKVTKEKAGPSPYETLRMALDDEAFNPVRKVVMEVGEGPLALYRPAEGLTALREEEQ